MESTSEVSCTNTESTTMTCDSTESTARTRIRRGISLKACVAKAAGWTLEKAKHTTSPEVNDNKMA